MIFPTNQSKRTSHNARTNEILHYKSQIKVASERRVNESDISFERCLELLYGPVY